MSERPTAEKIIEQVKASGSRKVKVAITDIDGILRGKYMHVDKFLSAVKSGFGFCNVVFGWDSADICYDNVAYTGWHSGYPDAEARIDLSTYRTIPWDDNTPFFLADFVDEKGSPLYVCPRQLLRKVISQTADAGFDAVFGMEFEFFNFEETPDSAAAKGYRNLKPMTPGMFGYSILRSSLRQPYFSALFEQLSDFDVPVEGLHTETGPGVYEAAILRADPLTAADRATLFKTGAKEIGYQHGVIPTFMAKISKDLPGCSGHIHQSLWIKDGKPTFYDANDAHGMSETFKHYLAGQLHCLPHILPMYAPTINSYKRLVEGAWAPTTVTWGVDNRTVACRVIGGSPKSTRVETRVVGSDANPYLAMAAALASGLYGIKNKLKLPSDPVTGNGYTVEGATRLPGTLEEAATAMLKSEVAAELFGDAFVKHFANTRLWETRAYKAAVTDWEMQRYFELI